MRLLAGHNLAQWGGLLVGHALSAQQVLEVISVAVGGVTPASSALVVGQALQDTTGWVQFLDPGNYESADPADVGELPDVVPNFIGDTPDAITPFTVGQTNRFSITVSWPTSGNSRTFTVAPRTVLDAAPVLTAPASASGTPIIGGNLTGVVATFDGTNVTVTSRWEISASGTSGWSSTGDTDTTSPALLDGMYYRFASTGENAADAVTSYSAVIGPVVASEITVAGGGVTPQDQLTYSTQLISEIADHASIASLANFISNAGTIASVGFQTQAGGTGPWTTRASNYALLAAQRVRVRVADDQGNEAFFELTTAVIQAFTHSQVPAEAKIVISVEDIVADAKTTQVTLSGIAAPNDYLNGTYSISAAQVRTAATVGPVYIGNAGILPDGPVANLTTGSVLSALTGFWIGAYTFTYQWLRDGADITGATSATYALTSDDLGTLISCRLSNDDGTNPATDLELSGIPVPPASAGASITTLYDSAYIATHAALISQTGIDITAIPAGYVLVMQTSAVDNNAGRTLNTVTANGSDIGVADVAQTGGRVIAYQHSFVRPAGDTLDLALTFSASMDRGGRTTIFAIPPSTLIATNTGNASGTNQSILDLAVLTNDMVFMCGAAESAITVFSGVTPLGAVADPDGREQNVGAVIAGSDETRALRFAGTTSQNSCLSSVWRLV
ncbi:hypothetical protein KX928_12530 [Roseobacter sp. YSTF-M11]|uniref:Uncharacterized protein n=1 Tax=Roseobacter insulae TaxID=2859783 RepID=A0A9X1FX26_9RHOB|nr:hypothetical protein [Roseobacter insulae]MBW4708610.1 hypothetical protein [Roseobacter insulae]